MKTFTSSWRLPIRHGDLVTDLTVYAIPRHFATAEPGDVVLIDDAPREVVGVCRDPFALVARDADEDDGPRLDADSGRPLAENVAAEFGIPVSELLPPRPRTLTLNCPRCGAEVEFRVDSADVTVAAQTVAGRVHLLRADVDLTGGHTCEVGA